MLHKVVSTLHSDAPAAAITDKLLAVEQSLRETALQINHEQKIILEEIRDRSKNSGTVMLSESEMLVKIFSGIKLYVDPRDIAVVPHLALDAIWEHDITAAWLKVVRENDTILDIGANFGYFGAIAAQRTNKKTSKVVLFEANPHLVSYLQKTLAVNWLNEQTVIENLAVSDSNEPVTLHLLKDYIGSSSVLETAALKEYLGTKMSIVEQEGIAVQAVTIDSYCRSHKMKTVDLIKMDIEGYEDKAYAGMRAIVANSPEITLFIEFTKDGYVDPRGFYDLLLQDFGNIYTITADGDIVEPADTSYDAIVGASDDWVMPIFSKKRLKDLLS